MDGEEYSQAAEREQSYDGEGDQKAKLEMSESREKRELEITNSGIAHDDEGNNR